ncbi:MAG TPA: HAD family phosphatase [Anaerolineaceae bacterium]|nr:HAD family phosphatase [Anaerolineaceae bacterium]
MAESSSIKPAIIFDFGGVLVDWNPYHLYRHFLGDDPEDTKHFMTEVDFASWNLENDRGRPLAQGVLELASRFPKYREMILAYDSRYPETISGPIQPVVEILKELKAAGNSLYGLSNWPADKFAVIRKTNAFFGLFDDIVISAEVKLVKPDPAIFQLLLNRIARPAQDCIFIDDSESNIRVAEELGFKTVLFKSAEQLVTELKIFGVELPRIQPQARP